MSTYVNNGKPIEKDMTSIAFDKSDKVSTKVFKAYPLLGDFTPSEKTLKAWFEVTRKYIGMCLDKRSTRFHSWVYDQVTLVIIHYAKSWKNNEESKFTRYISMQLGYRDDGGKIWNILTEALEKSFKQHNRFFIRRNGERQFYETVMVHSFSPYGAWNSLIDLLFIFFSENLDWTYVPGDPLFSRLVIVLQGYFGNAVEDDDYDIASHNYSLRIGIRRLIQERPGYTAHLFENIVKRIEQLLNNDTTETNRYSLKLVDKWFVSRVSGTPMLSIKKLSTGSAHAELALDYSKVTLRYVISEGRLAIRIPYIRLLGVEEGRVFLDLFEEENKFASFTLDIYGNELGETIQQKTLPLPTDSISLDELRFRVVIRRGIEIIYDSERKLWRQMLFFSSGKEININRLRQEIYDVFVPRISRLSGKNIEIFPLPHGLCKVALHKDFVLEYADNILAIDTSDIKGIRIVNPVFIENMRYVLNGEDYFLVRKGTSVKVYCQDESEAKKYYVDVNGRKNSLLAFFDSFAGNRAIIPVQETDLLITVSIIDIAAGTVIFKENYALIPDLECSFNQKLYVSQKDYSTFSANIHCDGRSFRINAVEKDEIHFEYGEGLIVINIPCIKVTFNKVETVFFEKYVRAQDITDTSELEIINKSGRPYTLKVGNTEITNADRVFLNRFVNGIHEKDDKLDIILDVDGQIHPIGQIVFGNVFAHNPNIAYSDDCLLWDGGVTYVGNSNAELSLVLFKNGKFCYSFELHLSDQLIYRFKDTPFVDGKYDWMIFADNQMICHGRQFIGNESRARFDGKTICVSNVTEDVDEKSTPVSIKPVYIDQIRYKDTCYVNTEEGIYDVYSGCMYWVDRYGERRYYSFKYDKQKSRYQINPVKIIYISDRYLRIVNEENEGILYHYKDEGLYPGNEITDKEPSKRAVNIGKFHDILFCLYDLLNDPSHVSEKEKYKGDITEETVSQILTTKKLRKNERQETEEILSLKNLVEVSQNNVICAPVSQRILVNAGPGTGKTWTLIERIIYLVQNDIEPESIQVLCFSRAAVEVIRKRMIEAMTAGRVDLSINRVDIRTFDSFATQMLYWVKNSEYDEVKKDFRIESLDYKKRIILFREVLRAQPELIEQCEHLIVDEVQDLVLERAEMVLDLVKFSYFAA